MRASPAAMHHKLLFSIALMIAAGVLLDAPVFAQESADATRGWKLAFGTCAVCHGVHDNEKSGSGGAPTFSSIANVKGMSAMALNVALQSSHRSMPNIMLDAQERADVIAFILTLKTD
jgi:mono/diheme cytochrome c family protein